MYRIFCTILKPFTTESLILRYIFNLDQFQNASNSAQDVRGRSLKHSRFSRFRGFINFRFNESCSPNSNPYQNQSEHYENSFLPLAPLGLRGIQTTLCVS